MSVIWVIELESACAVLYRDLCSVWTYFIFPHYLIKGTILEKNY